MGEGPQAREGAQHRCPLGWTHSVRTVPGRPSCPGLWSRGVTRQTLYGGLSLWGAQRTGCSANRRKGLRDSPCTPKHGVNGQFGSHGRGGREVPQWPSASWTPGRAGGLSQCESEPRARRSSPRSGPGRDGELPPPGASVLLWPRRIGWVPRGPLGASAQSTHSNVNLAQTSEPVAPSKN